MRTENSWSTTPVSGPESPCGPGRASANSAALDQPACLRHDPGRSLASDDESPRSHHPV